VLGRNRIGFVFEKSLDRRIHRRMGCPKEIRSRATAHETRIKAAMTDIRRFFGVDGAFKEACEMYQSHSLPMDIVVISSRLGNSEIAFRLGYCFSEVLKRRGMSINDLELDVIARNKIGYGDPRMFIEGFHESQLTKRGSRK
jgi:hypothetical protein